MVTLALFAACEGPDQGLAKTPDLEVAAPDLWVDPAEIDFGEVDAGAAATATFTLHNDGNASIDVTAIRMEGSADFTVAEAGPFEIAAESAVPVDVVFTPTSNRASALATIQTDEADMGAEVFLVGEGLYPALGVTPEPYEFGGVQVGCPRDGVLTLANIGGAPLRIDDAVVVGEGFTLTEPFAGPVELDPGEERELSVTFSPVGYVDHEAVLYITSNEPAGVRVVDVEGTGASATGEYVDAWRQPDGPWDAVDILFYVDQSCSMEDDQANLQANFAIFTSNLDGFQSDYQVMVSTDDDGCHNEDMVTRDTVGAGAVFSRAVSDPDGSGEATESGFIITKGALDQVDAGECNEGFLREGAKTLLVMVSDEPEQSEGAWFDYVAGFLEVAPTSTIVGIVGDMPDGCVTARAGRGYYEAAMETGGFVRSICETDWGGYFQDVASLVSDAPTDTFVLSFAPDLDLLTVTVDGVVVEGWTYDGARNAIVFDEDSIPAGGAWVEATYEVTASCG